MNLYCIYTSYTHRFAVGREQAQEVYTEYCKNRESETVNVAFITTLTDVTGDFE